MVRKTKEDSQITHEALLDAAEKVFGEKGVTRTTLNDVACAAGMTRGAIYWHFKDKTALFQSMCDRAFLPMDALLNEINCTRNTDPIAALKQLFVHVFVQAAENRRQRKVFEIIFHRCEKTEEMAFFMQEQEKRAECLSHMEAILLEAVRQGKLPETTDTFIAMQAIHAFLIGMLHEWVLNPEAYDLAARAEEIVDMMIAGLLTNPPRKPPHQRLPAASLSN
jgi:TetR/AcrR family acrAB operon transcriptional repressor